MSFDPTWIGKTIGDGAFSIEKWIMGGSSGGRLLGRDLRSGAPVHIGLTHALREPLAEARAKLMYEADGVAEAAFVGCPDGETAPGGHIVVVERVDPEPCLSKVRSTLSAKQQLRLGQRIAHVVRGATAQGAVLASFHPDLLRLDGDDTPTLFPRAPIVEAIKERRQGVGFGAASLSNQGPFWEAITINPWYATAETDVYCFGLLLSWLFTGRHPFAQAAKRTGDDWLFVMEADERDPFPGPPAIGAILDRMLLADRAHRAPIPEIAAMLDALGPADVT